MTAKDALFQVYSTNLGQVVDIVVSHQGVATKTLMVSQLMSSLVLPAPEHYRPLLRRLAALGESAPFPPTAERLFSKGPCKSLACVGRTLLGMRLPTFHLV